MRQIQPLQSAPRHAPLGARRFFAVLASLPFAIVLLSLFAACLAGATLLESRYGAHIAQECVYRSWWFGLLLGLLAVNVLCAALKKWPWKRHQTGFLITHAGLLVLLAGGLLTSLFGIEGQMILIDTADPDLQARVGLSNWADTIYLTGAHQIEVYRLKKPQQLAMTRLARLLRALDRGEEMGEEARPCIDRAWTFNFMPSPFPWRSDEHLHVQLPWELTVLHALASPSPGYARDLDGSAILTVENFYPHTESTSSGKGVVPRNAPPGAEEDGGFNACIRGRVTDAAGTEEFWAVLSREAARVRLGPDFYLIRYRPQTRRVDFVLTLTHARQLKDPGTDRPAAFQSEVIMTTARGGNRRSSEYRIVMNHPLQNGLLRVYQTNYRALLDPRTHEPILDGQRQVSLSGLTVASDPGLWLKYTGSLTVVLGIATMFYMKAYFFRRV
jgi:hypothetical protein